MLFVGALLSIQFVILTAYLLMKRYNSQTVLLCSGLMMLMCALLIGFPIPELQAPTGLPIFNLFKTIQEILSSKGAGVGLMIMTVGGYVAYIKKIKASEALVYVSMQPLSVFRKYPYVAASLVIPLGQILFMCIPSATGLGILLVASIYPILLSLGVSRLTAASVICACTVFDMGPGSANTAYASELIGQNNLFYFIEHQLPLTVPLTVLLMVLFVFTNRYYDRKAHHREPSTPKAAAPSKAATPPKELRIEVPIIYAILPVLPLLLLTIFSKYIQIFDSPAELDTTTVMLISWFVAMIFELIRTRNVKDVFASMRVFWVGMGNIFASVVTLIVAAEVFARGLISLGFVEALVQLSQYAGFTAIGIVVIMTLVIFSASILMGSGNASFSSFAPLIPQITTRFGMSGADTILPMQLASSMGRAASPIAAMVIAISEIAGVSSMELAKRNFIPLGVTLVTMLVVHFLLF